MNIFTISNIIKEYALESPNVNSAYIGDIYQINAEQDVRFSSVIIQQRAHRENGDFIYYDFTLFYIDRLLEDESNRLEIQSIGNKVLHSIINAIDDKYYCLADGDITYTSFKQKFNDNCAGQYCDVSFVFPLSECEDDQTYEETIQTGKKVTIIENGTITVIPDEGYSTLKSVTINTQVDDRIEGEKSTVIKQNGITTITPDEGYNGIRNINITTDVPDFIKVGENTYDIYCCSSWATSTIDFFDGISPDITSIMAELGAYTRDELCFCDENLSNNYTFSTLGDQGDKYGFLIDNEYYFFYGNMICVWANEEKNTTVTRTFNFLRGKKYYTLKLNVHFYTQQEDMDLKACYLVSGDTAGLPTTATIINNKAYATGIFVDGKDVYDEVTDDGKYTFVNLGRHTVEFILPTSEHTESDINIWHDLRDEAFYQIHEIKLIDIHNVQYIGHFAFFQTDVVYLYLPSTVRRVGDSAFGESDLYTIRIAENNFDNTDDRRTFGNNVFAYCNHLQTITFDGTFGNWIPRGTFYKCKSLGYIKIPSGVTHIILDAFAGSGLVWAEYPSTLKFIGQNAFLGCRLQSSLNLSSCQEGLEIGDSAFAGNAAMGLEGRFPSGVTFGECAFLSDSITDVYMKDNTAPSIDQTTFRNCNNTAITVHVPKGATGYDEWLKYLPAGSEIVEE